MDLKAKQLGIIGEEALALEFIKNGFTVSKPIGDNAPYDLIVDINGILKKIQVKTTEKVHEGGTMYWVISKSRQNHKNYRKEFYDNEIDGFGLYCIENNYMGYISKEECDTKYNITLRIEVPKNNMKKGVKFSKDYTLKRIMGE